VLMAVAKLFWIDRKLSKARSWFQRAISANTDLGDVWVYAYRFELEHGTPVQQAALREKCIQAAPTHGEIWCIIAKQDAAAGMKPDEILKKAASKLAPDVFTPYAPLS
jgi:pre-mRNA-processing factor 6